MSDVEKRVPFLLLDTCVIISAQQGDETFSSDCAELIALGESGKAQLAVSTGVAYDREKASPEVRERGNDWLAQRPFIAVLGGVFTLGVSRLGSRDVLAGDDLDFDSIHSILGPASKPSDQVDAHHAYAALHNSVRAFVTTNSKDFIDGGKREALASAGVTVWTPREAVEYINSSNGIDRDPLPVKSQ